MHGTKLKRIHWTCLFKIVMMMSNSHMRSWVRNLAFLILPEFSHLGLAAATERLFVANWLAPGPVFDWKVISVDGKPVRASNRIVLPIDGDLTSAAGCRSVFVLASFERQHFF
jgi:AraC family carnitine catabolism transcriptional activator